MGTTICGSSSRGVWRMANAPSNRAATITRGVSFESMKPRATFPARPCRFQPGAECAPSANSDVLLSALIPGSVTRLNLFSAQFEAARVADQQLPGLQACQDLHLLPRR